MLSCRHVPLLATIALASLRVADAFTAPLPMAAAARRAAPALSPLSSGVKVGGARLGGKVRGVALEMALFGGSGGGELGSARAVCPCAHPS